MEKIVYISGWPSEQKEQIDEINILLKSGWRVKFITSTLGNSVSINLQSMAYVVLEQVGG